MKSFKIKDLMIHVQPECGANTARGPIHCQVGNSLICAAAISVCHGACSRLASVICNTAISACNGACSRTVSICEACSAHPSCVGCSLVACTGNACSANACSANVCSARVCSYNVCTDVACSLAVCSFNVCSDAGSIGCLVPNSQGGCGDISCGDTFDTIGTVSDDCDPDQPARQSANLAALKAQLKRQLAAIEEHEKATNEALKPQTVAEVDDLQKKLQAALEELKARRTELEQAEKSKEKPKAK
jgi:hypothetical protein